MGAAIWRSALLERFEDRADGGFFFTANDHEPLIHRPKPGPDNATPSGNGVAALALQRFGHLVGEPRYLEAAERALRLFFPQMQQHASAFSTSCLALAEYVSPPTVVILRGAAAPQLAQWSTRLANRYLPATPGSWPCPRVNPGCPRRWTSRTARVSTPGFVAALIACRRYRISWSWTRR